MSGLVRQIQEQALDLYRRAGGQQFLNRGRAGYPDLETLMLEFHQTQVSRQETGGFAFHFQAPVMLFEPERRVFTRTAKELCLFGGKLPISAPCPAWKARFSRQGEQKDLTKYRVK